MTKKLIAAVLCLAMVLTMSVGCSSQQTDSPASSSLPATSDGVSVAAPSESVPDDPSASKNKALTIGMIQNQGSYFFQSIQDELERLAEPDGGQVIVVNADNDVNKEASAIQNFIQRKVDVILLSTQSPSGSLASVKAAYDAGIPVICYNSGLDGEDGQKYTKAYIKSDDTALGTITGEYAAQYIKDNLGGKVKLGILNADLFEVCKKRHEGFLKALEDVGIEYEVLSSQEAYVADKGATIAQNILTAHPDVDAFWASNDGGTAGAVAAIRAKTTDNRVVCFGTDINPELAAYIASDEDILQATTGQDGVAIARKAYEVAQKVAAGEEITPFEQLIPGQLFFRGDSAIDAYL